MELRTIFTHTAVQGTGDDASANSSGISIGRARGVSLQLIATNIVAGSATVSVDVSNDGQNWVDYNMLISNVNSSATVELDRLSSYNITTSTSVAFLMYPTPPFQFLRTSLVVSNDGSYSVILGVSQDK